MSEKQKEIIDNFKNKKTSIFKNNSKNKLNSPAGTQKTKIQEEPSRPAKV